MIFQRLVTSIVLIILFFLLVFKASNLVFAFVTLGVLLLGAYEWSFLMGVKKRVYALIYPLVLLIVTGAISFLPTPPIIWGACAWWFVAIVLVFSWPKSRCFFEKSMAIRGVMGVFTLAPCWLAINYIRIAMPSGAETLLFLFLLIWSADSGAWFVGRRWGRHLLLPAVSPGKTWEGVLGGMVAALIVMLLGFYWSNTPKQLWFGASILCVCTVMFAVLGDLFESMMKRFAGVKDSGRLLPGHGGVLDRIDSLTAAAPIYVAGAFLLDKIMH